MSKAQGVSAEDLELLDQVMSEEGGVSVQDRVLLEQIMDEDTGMPDANPAWDLPPPEVDPSTRFQKRREAVAENFPGNTLEEGSAFGDGPLGIMKRSYVQWGENTDETELKLWNQFGAENVKRIDLPVSDDSDEVQTIFGIKQEGKDTYKLVNPVKFDVSDIANIVEYAPEVAADFFVLKGMGKLAATNKLKGMFKHWWFRDFLGGATGPAVKEGIEALRDESLDDPTQVAGQMVSEGGLSALGGKVAGTFKKAGKAGGGFNDDPDALDAFNRLKEMYPEAGVEIPSTDRFSSHPGYSRFASQARATSGHMIERDAAAMMGLTNVAKEHAGVGGREAGEFLRQAMEEYQDRSAADLLAEIGDISQEAGNINIRTAFKRNTLDRLKNARDVKYSKVPDGLEFDMSSVKELAAELLSGTPVSVEGEMVPAFTPTGDFKKLLAAIVKMDDVQSLNALKAARTQAFDMQYPDITGRRNTAQGNASRLHSALTQTMENPVAGPPGGIQRLKIANKFNRYREDFLNKETVQAIAKSDNPTKYAAELLQPGNYDELVLLKHAVGKDVWEQYKSAARRSVLYDISRHTWTSENNVEKVVDDWMRQNSKSWNLLFNSTDTAMFRRIGKSMNDLSQNQFAKTLKSIKGAGGISYDLVVNKSPEEINEIIQRLGGRGSEGHRMLKYAFLDDFYHRALKTNLGEFKVKIDGKQPSYGGGARPSNLTQMLDPRALGDALKSGDDMRFRGSLEALMDASDMETIKNIQEASRVFAKSLSDSGASLQVAQDYASTKDILIGDAQSAMKGAHGIGMNKLIGMLMSSDFMTKRFAKAFQDPTSQAGIRAAFYGLTHFKEFLAEIDPETRAKFNTVMMEFAQDTGEYLSDEVPPVLRDIRWNEVIEQ